MVSIFRGSLAVATLSIFAWPVAAQEAREQEGASTADQQTVSSPPAGDQSSNADEIVDEVIVTGRRRGADSAMDAFLRGDYATAEIEFQKNFERLKRQQSLQDSSYRDAQLQASRVPEPTGPSGAAGAGQGAEAAAAASTASTSGSFNPSFAYSKGADDGIEIVSSGTDLGAQLYMKGLSQLQLGKFDDARSSFERALRLNDSLFDVHYRLGLLDVQAGDIESAKRRLKKFETGARRCKSRCPDKEEFQRINRYPHGLD